MYEILKLIGRGYHILIWQCKWWRIPRQEQIRQFDAGDKETENPRHHPERKIDNRDRTQIAERVQACEYCAIQGLLYRWGRQPEYCDGVLWGRRHAQSDPRCGGQEILGEDDSRLDCAVSPVYFLPAREEGPASGHQDSECFSNQRQDHARRFRGLQSARPGCWSGRHQYWHTLLHVSLAVPAEALLL